MKNLILKNLVITISAGFLLTGCFNTSPEAVKQMDENQNLVEQNINSTFESSEENIVDASLDESTVTVVATTIGEVESIPNQNISSSDQNISSSDIVEVQTILPRQYFSIKFELNSSEFRKDQKGKLFFNATLANAKLVKKIILVGHSDSSGYEQYNYDLGLKRAASVSEFLIQNGVPADKIEIKSAGEENSTCKDSDELCLENSRIVSITEKL